MKFQREKEKLKNVHNCFLFYTIDLDFLSFFLYFSIIVKQGTNLLNEYIPRKLGILKFQKERKKYITDKFRDQSVHAFP